MKYEYISMDTIEENKKLLGEVERLRNEKQELLETIDMITNDASEYVKRIDKAIKEIEYFELKANHLDDEIYLDEELSNKLLNILRGKDNEIN